MNVAAKQCGGKKVKKGTTTSTLICLKKYKQSKRNILHRLKGRGSRSVDSKGRGDKKVCSFSVVDSNERSHGRRTTSSPSRLVSARVYHHLKKMHCPTLSPNASCKRSANKRRCSANSSTRHKVSSTAKSTVRSRSKDNPVVSTTESSSPNSVFRRLNVSGTKPYVSGLFLYDQAAPDESFSDYSKPDGNNETSESIFTQCMDSNPRDTFRSQKKVIYACMKAGTPPALVGDAPPQGDMANQAQVSSCTQLPVNDGVFTTETPANECSVKIKIQLVEEEVEEEYTSVTAGKTSGSLILHPKAAVKIEAPTLLTTALSWRRRTVSQVGILDMNASNTRVEEPASVKKNPQKTIWQRLFKKNSKGYPKEAESAEPVNSKIKESRSTSVSRRGEVGPTTDTAQLQPDAAETRKESVSRNMAEALETTKNQTPDVQTRGNQTDNVTDPNKPGNMNERTQSFPDSSKIVYFRPSACSEAPLSSNTSKEGNKRKSKDFAKNSSKVISVEVSNSSVASVDSDFFYFVQVAKSFSIENEAPNSPSCGASKVAPEEAELCKSRCSILDENLEEARKAKEGKVNKTNVGIKALYFNVISPQANCVDTTDEEDPFGSEPLTAEFTTKDSLDLCTWVEKPVHSKITIAKNVDKAATIMEETECNLPSIKETKLRRDNPCPKDSLDLYVLGDVDPTEKIPFKNEFRILLKSKKCQPVKRKSAQLAEASYLPNKIVKWEEESRRCADVIDEVPAQFNFLRKVGSDVQGRRACMAGNVFRNQPQTKQDEVALHDEPRISASSGRNRNAPYQLSKRDCYSKEAEDSAQRKPPAFRKVKVFITSPESKSCLKSASPDEITSSPDVLSPLDAPKCALMQPPSAAAAYNYRPPLRPPSAPEAGPATWGHSCHFPPGYLEKQLCDARNTVMEQNRYLPMKPLPYGSVMCSCSTAHPTPLLLTKPHVHPPAVPHKCSASHPARAAYFGPVGGKQEPISEYVHGSCTPTLIGRYTPSGSKISGPLKNSHCSTYGGGRIENRALMNRGSLERTPVAPTPTRGGYTTSEVAVREQVHPQPPWASRRCIHEVPATYTRGLSSGLTAPYLSHSISNSAVVKTPSNMMRSSEKTATQFDVFRTEESDRPCSQFGSLNANRHTSESAQRTNPTESSVSGRQSKPSLANKATLSTTMSSVDSHSPQETMVVSGKHVRMSGEGAWLTSTVSAKGFSTEIEIVDVDVDYANGHGERRIREKHCMGRSVSGYNSRKTPSWGIYNTKPTFPRVSECNREADFEVSISMGDTSRTESKIPSNLEIPYREDRQNYPRLSLPPPQQQQQQKHCPRHGDIRKSGASQSTSKESARVPLRRVESSGGIPLSEMLKTPSGSFTGSNSEETRNKLKGCKGGSHASHADRLLSNQPLIVQTNRKMSRHEVLEELQQYEEAKEKRSCFLDQDYSSRSVDSERQEAKTRNDSSRYQNVVVTPKDSLTAAPSPFQALNVEVKANPAWLCQGMFVRAVKTRKESGFIEETTGADENGSISSALLTSQEHTGNQSTSHSGCLNPRKVKDARIILGFNMEEKDSNDQNTVKKVDRSNTVSRPPARTISRDSIFHLNESKMTSTTHSPNKARKSAKCGENRGRSNNSRSNLGVMGKIGKEDDARRGVAVNELVGQLPRKSSKIVKSDASTTSSGCKNGEFSSSSATPKPVPFFVPGDNPLPQMIKLRDDEINHPSGWCILPLPVYRTQHELCAAYAQQFFTPNV